MSEIISRSYENIRETVYSAVLPNGLRIQVIPKRGFSTSYAVFATDYGGAYRRFKLNDSVIDTPAGVAHFLEHKMFDLPDGDSALRILSANGADPNAFTSSDMTCYYFQCTRCFEDNLKMLLHFVATPYFTPETVQKEQGIIGQEISMGDDSPGQNLYYNLLSLLYGHHPIRDKVVGTAESISQITAETLYNCHKIFYAPSNMVLCVEGDVDPQRIVDIAEEILPHEKSTLPEADFGEEESLYPLAARRSDQAEISAPQFYIGAKFRPAKSGDEQLRQRLISQLALRVLVGSSSRFYTGLYAAGLLNRDFDFEADYSAGTATVLIGGESRDPDEVLARLNAEILRLGEAGFDPDAFERAKRASLGSRLRALEDFESVCISSVVGLFAGYSALDAISQLEAVSREDCERFILDTLAPERIALSIITPKKD